MAQARFDRGAVAPGTPMERMILVLRGTPEQDHQLRTLLDSQQTKGSPDYHHWLTPDEIGQRFGPSPQDIQQVVAWLLQQGFRIGSVGKSGRWIEFSGTAAQVNQAFQTQMRTFLVEGKLHTANSTDISIPAALAPVVQGVASLHNFYSEPLLRRSLQHAKPALIAGKTGSGPQITFTDGSHAVAPADFATIYNLNPLYQNNINGTGETIAIVGVSNITTSDVATFRSLFGIAPNGAGNPLNVILNGPDPGIIPGVVDEATIDVEWSGSVAPQAAIDLVVSGGTLTTDPVLLSSIFIVDNDLAPIMSVSFGNCEQALGGENALFAVLWQQAAAQGISVFVATGDTGAAGCDPNGGNVTVAQGGIAVSGVASTQFNTAVGGTEFNETVNGGVATTFWNASSNPTTLESAIGYIPEKVWNDSCVPSQSGSVCQQFNFISLASGSGGISTLYGPPSWQSSAAITGLQGAGFPNRVLPDVSLTAASEHDPLAFCVTDAAEQLTCTDLASVSFAGGTSFASPSFAGIMALVVQDLKGQRQGLANYVLYPLAAGEFASSSTLSPCDSSKQTNPATPSAAFKACTFADTTAGNNGVPGNDTLQVASPGNAVGQLGYNAITGFDLGTGLGSVNANNLVTAWSKVTFQGSTTTLSASVNGTPSTAINIVHGQPVSITMNVAAMVGTKAPTGEVALLAQGGNLPSPSAVGVVGAPLPASGSATATAGPLNVNNLPGGTNYNVIANYPGDGTFGSSTSSPTAITVTVTPEGTATTLNSDIFNGNTGIFSAGTTVAYGDPLNLLVLDAVTSGVSGLLPTSGTVSFTDNGNALTQTVIDNSGIGEIASCFSPLPACLTPGQHVIVASYGGDGTSYNGSTSASVTITVTPGAVTPIISGPTTVIAGQQFTLQVQVQPFGLATIIPTGSVQFFDGSAALGGALTLSTGSASIPVTLNSGGVHSITARFSPGDGNYNGATSATFTVAVSAPFNFAAPINAQTIAAGSTATFNVTLSSVGGFAGAVNLTCAGATGGATCSVSPNPANLTASTTSIPVTVTVSNTTNARMAPSPLKSLPWALASAFAIFLWGAKRKPRQALLMVVAVALIVGVSSCGGGGGGIINHSPPTVDVLTVTGSSGAATSNINLTLTITH